MTDVADRHWGQSLVRAPTAKDAVRPRPPVTPGEASAAASPPPAPGPRLVRGAPSLLRVDGATSTLAGTSLRAAPSPPDASSAPAPAATRPAVVGVAPASPPILPPMPPMPPMRPVPVLRSAPAAGPPESSRSAPAAAVFPWPVAEPAVAHPDLPADPLADPSLARLARGIQDCARALASLADRIDGLERRLDGVDHPVSTNGATAHDATAAAETIEVRLRALEGMADDRVRGLDQRLHRLESLPGAVTRLQQHLVLLAEVGAARRPDDGGGADLAAVYEQLDAVAELVSAHHGAANQSLERVRTLERAVLEMSRIAERNRAEHARVATAELAGAISRIDRLEARVHAAESSLPPARS